MDPLLRQREAQEGQGRPSAALGVLLERRRQARLGLAPPSDRDGLTFDDLVELCFKDRHGRISSPTYEEDMKCVREWFGSRPGASIRGPMIRAAAARSLRCATRTRPGYMREGVNKPSAYRSRLTEPAGAVSMRQKVGKTAIIRLGAAKNNEVGSG